MNVDLICISLVKQNIKRAHRGELRNEEADTQHAIKNLYAYWMEYWYDDVRPETFSVFGLEHRTNNLVESWHNWFNNLCNGKHLNIWDFICESLFSYAYILSQLAFTHFNGDLLAKNNATTFCNNENLVFLVESEHKKLQDLDHWLAGGCIGRPQPKKYTRRDRTIAENARLLEELTLSIRNFLRRSRLLFNIFEVRVF